MKHIGRYRLDTVHGFGAFATVWRGYDTELDIPVAVKVLAENWANHADVHERFLAEARILRRIASDRVVRVYDVGTHEGQPFFVMDFIDGGTMADRIGAGLEPAVALNLAAEAARAVQVLHDEGVVHRDVKPSNLLIAHDPSGHDRVLISDLGSAKQLAGASGFTVTTGTPAYMAPEQALGQPITERSDVYALGVVTFELLAGRPPFDSSDPAALLSRAATHKPRPLAADLRLPTSLDDLLGRTTSVDPLRRPASAHEFAGALDRIAGGQKRHGLDRIATRWSSATVALGGAVSFAATAGFAWWWTGR